jgi:hypothetical protein
MTAAEFVVSFVALAALLLLFALAMSGITGAVAGKSAGASSRAQDCTVRVLALFCLQ